MAITKVTRNMLNTGIVDNSNATAITIDSSENVTFASNITMSNASSPTILMTDTTNTLSLKMFSGNTTGNIGTTTNHDLTFFSNDAERMRSNSSGVVSITKAGSLFTPLSNDGLVVQHSDATGIRIIDSGNAGNNGGHVGIGNDNGNLQLSTAGVMLFDTGFEPTDQLYNGRHERMRIDSSGNVGIGDTNPGAKLDVNSGTTNTMAHFHSTDDNGFIELRDDDTAGYIGVQNSHIYIGGAASNAAQSVNIKYNTGYIGIGNAAPERNLDIMDFQTNGSAVGIEIGDVGYRSSKDTANFSYHMRFYNTNGQVGYISTTNSATAYITSSDYRLKENIDYDWDATSRLKQLKPVRFNWISDESNTAIDGFLAHEVSSIVPEAISGEKDAVYTEEDAANNEYVEGDPKYQGIDQSKLVPLLVKTIQELEARITTLEG